MTTKFVTAIYSNLYGTKFGGRINRGGHYRWSLLSILKITDAHFTCYTDPNEESDLKRFFYEENNISETQLKIIAFNLEDHFFVDLFNKYKDFEIAKQSDRCIELQYMKFIWSVNECIGYDKVYWIDAGLSHCGLIPNRYLSLTGPHNRGFYESSLFNNNFLYNLNLKSENKFLLVGKENMRNFWSGTVRPENFINFDMSIHIIGGLFGGNSNLWYNIVEKFKSYVESVTLNDGRLYHEEDIMTLMFRNHPEIFKHLEFDTWLHPEAPISGLSDDHFTVNKSFYKILEELQ